MEHTPGPWAIEDPMPHQLWIVEAGKQPHDWRDIAIICEGEYGWPAETAKANARLVAAAPDLLAALEAMTDQLERIGDNRKDAPYIDAARAAIAKAKGEA